MDYTTSDYHSRNKLLAFLCIADKDPNVWEQKKAKITEMCLGMPREYYPLLLHIDVLSAEGLSQK